MQQLGYATAYARLPKRLTVRENLRMYALCYGFSTVQVDAAIERTLKAFDAYHLIDKQAHGLSAGQTTRVLLAKAFLGNPEMVLLDEPTASLDPDVVEIVRHFLLAQRTQHGVSILLASHDMDEVAEVCDRVLVLKDGSIIAQDTPLQLALTVRTARLALSIEQGLPQAVLLAQEKQLVYQVTDKEFVVHLNEIAMSDFLMALARAEVRYSHIALEKPTLEDYFLTIARQRSA
jgi:ABC-2 type transport system ATP-binding protein